MSQPPPGAFGVPIISPFSAFQSAWPRVCHPARLEPLKVTSGWNVEPRPKSSGNRATGIVKRTNSFLPCGIRGHLYFSGKCISKNRLKPVEPGRIVDQNRFADRWIGRPDRKLVEHTAVIDRKERDHIHWFVAGRRGRV